MANEWLREIPTAVRSIRDLEATIGSARVQVLADAAERLRAALGSRRIVNVNSSVSGGGAAEMLRDLIPYARDAGIDCRWIAIGGDPGFYAITKRIHYRMYGFVGDGGPLGPEERRRYELVHAGVADQLTRLVRPGDIVLLHDPQPLGLAGVLRTVGVRTAWRCHIGRDDPNEHTEQAWSFLRPYLENVEAFVFHRRKYAPAWLDENRVVAIPPSIEPFATKNRPLAPPTAAEIVAFCGLRQSTSTGAPVSFTRRDGRPAVVHRPADVLQSGAPPPAEAPLVTQVSRWDPMKDMPGVMTAFADHLDGLGEAHLLLAGPSVTATADDPYAAEVLLQCMSLWRRLPYQARARIHLACLPMADVEENALVVNALQRESDVVVQKSRAEGFGLTVAEAMWKARPVIATAVGGIRDQITKGTGLLISLDDVDAFGLAIGSLLRSPAKRSAMGAAGHERILESFMPDRHLLGFADLFTAMVVATRDGA